MAISRVLSPILVGRDSELSALEDALLSALRGDGGVVIVGGEAGMGKTRLVNALASRAHRLDCAVMSGGCSEAELSLPYLPFLEAIGNFLASAEVPALRERLGAAADELAQLFPQLGRPVTLPGDPSQAKMRLFESILMLLRDAASRRALLVILEDLQWADPATRELLDYSTRRLRSTNVLIVATYRTDEMHRKHALLPTIQGWRRNGQVAMIDLNPLTAEQVGEMVCAIFEERSISDEFRDFLRERSEGNPFVLEEMLRDALDRGDIFRTETGWDRKALAEMRIPPTVRDTILQRLERLSHDDVMVLSAGSVMGRSFDLGTLAEVAQVDQLVALRALEASVLAQLIEQEDRVSGRYRFRHALTREAIYEELVVPRRQQLHSRVADVLEARGSGAPVDLANHLLMAGRNDEAVAMCVAAAEDAMRARAYRDAGELLERAGAYVADRAERARMLCRAGAAYHENNESATARRLLEQAIPDLESAGLEAEAAGYRIVLGRCYWELMRTDLAGVEFKKALTVLEPLGPSEALANAYIRMATQSMVAEDYRTTLDFARQGYETAERASADLSRDWSLNFVGIAKVGLGEVDAGFEALDRSYQGAMSGRHGFQIGNAVYNAVWTAVYVARGDIVERWSHRVPTMLQGGNEPWPPYIRGVIAIARGEIDDAIGHARTGIQKSRDAGHEKMRNRCELLLAHALAENMLVSEALAALPPTSMRVDLQDMIYDAAPRVRCRLAAGDFAGAEAQAKLIPPEACALGTPVDAVAEAVTDAGWLRAYVDQIPTRGEVLASPRIGVARGRAALLDGRYPEAVEELRRAVDRLEGDRFLLDAWHGGRALAEAEFRAGDAEAAQRRLRRIVAEASAHGALLAAKLAADTAARIGVDAGVVPHTGQPPSTPQVATGERMVSVLFADVRDYTELSSETAPADLADRIATLQRWAIQEVERRHGILDKFAGDAVMATFNVSGQSVDHAVQAVRAALTIIDKASLAGLPVGAAVAVGPAVVGNLAASANVSVLGEVTNLAARLQAHASAGQVLMSDEVYRRARDWLGAQHIPADRIQLELKGFSAPVPAYRVTTGVAATASA